ncbi:MAG TPA: hypothetical protein VIL32_16330, partial [Steroidobacteraceae bacterium]
LRSTAAEDERFLPAADFCLRVMNIRKVGWSAWFPYVSAGGRAHKGAKEKRAILFEAASTSKSLRVTAAPGRRRAES